MKPGIVKALCAVFTGSTQAILRKQVLLVFNAIGGTQSLLLCQEIDQTAREFFLRARVRPDSINSQ
ncbi:hypothetical protein SAMN04488515_0309 [Cognatiyoonia koreensis]|uniref:Uncharacterized protein n=1 Tax=Cognatiyoonia koreensis TaxID=364200 RepID=A0A1I0MY81_9RHOB|nr:hypothetical protein SAMN04488515_0309 [Cognatiyoonia koreensis]